MDFGLLLRQGIIMKISLIHASYGRPVLAMMTAWKWAENTSGKHQIEYLLSIDQADNSDYPDSVNWKQDYIESKVIKNLTSTSVAAINNAAEKSTGDIIVVMSDDFECPQDWDDLIVKATKGKSDWILKTQDGTQPWIITLPIMDRTYYNRFGYVYYSAYTHMFCDTEISAVADLLGKRITSDLLFQHKHYSTKNGIGKDKTSVKADATWNQGEALFMKRAANYFGIESPMPCQKLDDTIKWINNKNKK
jgi:hypothetical protein